MAFAHYFRSVVCFVQAVQVLESFPVWREMRSFLGISDDGSHNSLIPGFLVLKRCCFGKQLVFLGEISSGTQFGNEIR